MLWSFMKRRTEGGRLRFHRAPHTPRDACDEVGASRKDDTQREQKSPKDRGAAAVEFALVLPVLMAVVFGILEYGWIFYEQFNLAGAVRDGLRQGVTVSQTANPDPKAFAISKAQADLQALGMTTGVAVTAAYSGASPTKTMTLTADLTYHKLIGFVPTPAHLKYTMTMMLELQ
jgi:Flp pilus assembly protein TadG